MVSDSDTRQRKLKAHVKAQGGAFESESSTSINLKAQSGAFESESSTSINCRGKFKLTLSFCELLLKFNLKVFM